MADLPEEFESTDRLGTTEQFDGTVGTTPVNIPVTPTTEISEFLIQCPYDQIDTNNLKVSLDGGSNYLTLQPSGFWAWTPKGDLKQITILGNVAGVKYEIVINKELN